MRKIPLAIVACLLSPVPVNATLINIETDATQISQSSYVFGDYIFELVNPANTQFNLIDGDPLGKEDFIASKAGGAGDFTLRRLDNLAFSLLGIRHAGQGTTTIGGVSVAEPGFLLFADLDFSGQAGVTSVTSILFSPASLIQLSAFEVESEEDLGGLVQTQLTVLDIVPIPEPGSLGLMLSGLLLLVFARLRHRPRSALVGTTA